MLGCNKPSAPDCATRLGEIAHETRTLNHFRKLDVRGRINVSLKQDSTNYAIVRHGRNVIDGVFTEVADGCLRIYEKNNCDWVRDITVWPEVEIHFTGLNNIHTQSAGWIRTADTLRLQSILIEAWDASGSLELKLLCDSLQLKMHTGAMDAEIAGRSIYTYVYNASYGPCYASDLTTTTGSVHSDGTGDIHIWCTEVLYYQIFDEGDVHVYGYPHTVAWNHSGSGKLILH
ncbi:MAG: hypothetical protein Kow0075_07920 [Salibacteraceae bacterium]